MRSTRLGPSRHLSPGLEHIIVPGGKLDAWDPATGVNPGTSIPDNFGVDSG